MKRNTSQSDNSSNRYLAVTAFLVILLLALISCDLTETGLQGLMGQFNIGDKTQPTTDNILTAPTQQALEATIASQNALATTLADQATQAASQPTGAPTGTAILPAQPTSSININSLIKSAKILLFENMSAKRIFGVYHPRYVQAALDFAGYSYTDVGSAQGWFKDQLVSSESWDLIIASSEAPDSIGGEFFTYLSDRVNKGEGVIIEMWDLDQKANGKIAPLLEKCGVGLYKDWGAAGNVAMWPLVPDHTIFNHPNRGISMRNTSPFWVYPLNDHGDLLKVTGTGDAELLLGTIEGNTKDHGTLASCMEGRLLLQTFRSHDFAVEEIEALWQNYVYYVLKSKLLTSP